MSDIKTIKILNSVTGGLVNSVNGNAGTVVLDTDDLDDSAATNKFTTAADQTKLGYITVTQAVDLDAMEAAAGDMLAANNLSDVASAATALSNLGGATAAQGALADSALQSGDIDTLAELNAIVGDATLGDAGDFPSISTGSGAPGSTPGAEGDIYVDTTGDDVYVAAGTASSADWKQATGAGGGDMLAANNLSDVASAATARTNLGVVIGTDVQAHDAVLDATTASFLVADETKLDGIEALADVTDTANVTAAGALMDSEVDADIKTLSLPASTTISTFGASLVDDADAAAARTTLGVITELADDTTPSLAGTLDGDGNDIIDTGVLTQREQASAEADVAGAGQWWTKTDATACRPMYTDDTGSDFELLTNDTGMAVSDESTDLTASTTTPLATFHAQRDGTWEEILIGVTTAPTGSTLTADVHKNGTTVFTTKPTIDASEKTSTTAATAAVLSTATYSKGDLIELFCDSVGSTVAGQGLKFYFNAYRT